MKKRFVAFTLAEVLITLSIIGIVAALTIPTLINNYQKKQYVTSLKKFYTQFNQVLAQIAVDNGCPGDLACTGLFATGTTSLSLGDELVKYFKVAKNCKTAANLGCWAKKTNFDYDISDPNNISFPDGQSLYKFTTIDDMSISIYNAAQNGADNENCKYSDWGRNITGHKNQFCGEVHVDINGPKGPNLKGRDTFYFSITNGKGPLLYPGGGIDSTDYRLLFTPVPCTPANKNGYTCTARIMEEGWEMNY